MSLELVLRLSDHEERDRERGRESSQVSPRTQDRVKRERVELYELDGEHEADGTTVEKVAFP